MIFDLLRDFTDLLDAMPREHVHYRILKLIDEAIRWNVHFVDHHRTTLFQCLWNSSCWYGGSETVESSNQTKGTRSANGSPVDGSREKHTQLLQTWLAGKEHSNPGFVWLRCLTPPAIGVDSGVTVLRGHQDGVLSVAVSHDGHLVVSGGRDGTIRVWHCESARELVCLHPYVEPVTEGEVRLKGRDFFKGVAFTPDGTQFISGGSWQGVTLWDALTFEPHFHFCGRQDGTGIRSGLEKLAISPCGSRIVCGIDDQVEVFDVQKRVLANCWECNGITDVAFSPDGKRIYASSSGHVVKEFDADTGAELMELSIEDDELWYGDPVAKDFWFDCIAVSPDGKSAAVGSFTGFLVLWDIIEQKEIARWRGHTGRIYSIAFSPDGQSILSGSRDATVRVWNTTTRNETACFRHHGDEVWAVAFFPDGQRILTASRDRTVCIRNIVTKHDSTSPAGQTETVTGACFTPDGRHVLSWRDSTIGVWNAVNGKREQRFQHLKEITDVALFRRHPRLASGSLDGTLHLWDWEHGREILRMVNGPHAISKVTVSPNERLVACGSIVPRGEKSSVAVWDTSDNTKPLWMASVIGDHVRCLMFSPDGRYLVAGALSVHIWEATTGIQTHAFVPSKYGPCCMSFSVRGDQAAFGTEDGKVIVLDFKQHALLACLAGHLREVDCVAFAPDGRHLVSSSMDGTIRVWDVALEECLEVIEGRSDLRCIASGDNSYTLCAVVRGMATWVESIKSGTCVAALPSVFTKVTACPNGRKWAGVASNELCIFALEGNTGAKPGTPNSTDHMPLLGTTQTPHVARRTGKATEWLTRKPQTAAYLVQLVIASVVTLLTVRACLSWPWGWILGGPIAVYGTLCAIATFVLLFRRLVRIEEDIICPECHEIGILVGGTTLHCSDCNLHIHVCGDEASKYKKAYLGQRKK